MVKIFYTWMVKKKNSEYKANSKYKEPISIEHM